MGSQEPQGRGRGRFAARGSGRLRRRGGGRSRSVAAQFGPATAKYRELGTVANLLTFNRFAALPTRNFQQGTFERGRSSFPARNSTPLAAWRVVPVPPAPSAANTFTPRPTGEVRLEYESLFALGPLCGSVIAGPSLQAAQLCDQLGLDTISAGATVAFAMECAERGLLDAPDLRFGNAPTWC